MTHQRPRHYAPTDIIARIRSAADSVGLPVESLTRDDMASFDEFHIGGRDQTRQLARAADVRPGEHVLDIGCGVGGPARTLAAEFGARVTATDVTFEFCRAATWLNRIVGLDDRIACVHADAWRLPFAAGSFEIVWMQHLCANIADKTSLFEECRRVMQPHGRLALFEVVAGESPGIHLPVFWAESAEHSHLLSKEAFLFTVEQAGFEPVSTCDLTDEAVAFFRSAMRIARAVRPPLSPSIIIPVDAGPKATNVLRNLEEGRIEVVSGVFRPR